MNSITDKPHLIYLNTLLQKYRNDVYAMYVEYPHKSFWSEEFRDKDYKVALQSFFSIEKDAPILLYVHIPFCPKQCFYCSCYSVHTTQYEMVKKYLSVLFAEIDLMRKFCAEKSVTFNIQEIHIGGGSPTFLHKSEFDQLISSIQSLGDIKHAKEVTIEIDPRMTTHEMLKYYYTKGINRISLGIQDFDPEVQEAVNRVQPIELVERLLSPEIRSCFKSINFDILCGLPRQSAKSFRKTIDTVIKLSPDRIALLFMHYIPDMRKHQRLMDESVFPTFCETRVFFHDSIHQLINNGYMRIGFDHFAKPTDSLGEAMQKKQVHWNGLGYRPGKYLDIIGLGVSSACRITPYYYSQNLYSLSEYEGAIRDGKFPIYRGYKLNRDDIIRRDVIHQLRCYLSVNCSEIEKQHGINFKEYFKEEGDMLNKFVEDGIIEISDSTIIITELGSIFTALVCRVFDKLSRIKGVCPP